MKTVSDIRRAALSRIVERDGLAAAARRFGKPDRQINDMLANRKSFGEKVARDMERSYAPDLPPGWLDIDADPPAVSASPTEVEGTRPYHTSGESRSLTAAEDSPRVVRIMESVRSLRNDDGTLLALEAIIDLGLRLKEKSRPTNDKKQTQQDVGNGEISHNLPNAYRLSIGSSKNNKLKKQSNDET